MSTSHMLDHEKQLNTLVNSPDILQSTGPTGAHPRIKAPYITVMVTVSFSNV